MREVLAILILLAGTWAMAQQIEEQSDSARQAGDRTQPAMSVSNGKITVPAGTQIPLRLKQAISTKNAKPGDAVYAETNFPITWNDRVVIPAGTYVQGRISEVKRPGRVKGRAEVLMHFTSLVFPSGYTAVLPGAVENLPGAENQTVKGEEGTVQQNGSKGKDARTVGEVAATGATIGGLAGQGLKGAAIGGGMGAATGLAIGLLTRGNDIMLPEGTSVQMVLQRPLVLDEQKVRR